jgi:sugar phosphate isomerase/epimerase
MFRIGMMPMNAIGDVQKCIDFAKQAEDYALKLKEDGIGLYYHNHHMEFIKVDGKYLLDLLRENAPHMGFELDTHWIHRGGENPVEFIKKYAGSVRLLHLKDYRIGNVEMPNMAGPDGMQKFVEAFFYKPVQFAELGTGTLPLKECIEAGLAGGAEYFLVEQDETYGRDPFECLKTSHDHLVELGYGDWF